MVVEGCSLEGRLLALLDQVWAGAQPESHCSPSGTRKGRIEALGDCRLGAEYKAGGERSEAGGEGWLGDDEVVAEARSGGGADEQL